MKNFSDKTYFTLVIYRKNTIDYLVVIIFLLK